MLFKKPPNQLLDKLTQQTSIGFLFSLFLRLLRLIFISEIYKKTLNTMVKYLLVFDKFIFSNKYVNSSNLTC